MLTDLIFSILIVCSLFFTFATIAFLFVRTGVVEVEYVARVLLAIVAAGLAIVTMLHCTSGDVTVYGANKPIYDEGMFWFFLLLTIFDGLLIALNAVFYALDKLYWVSKGADKVFEAVRETEAFKDE